MKYSLLGLLALACCALCLCAPARAATVSEEQRLITVLQSAAPPAEKDAACATLKLVGTPRCIPALAALLTDEQLSHSARYALEPMPSTKAGRALQDALARTSGLTRVGIIDSLGVRRDDSAVSALAKLLTDQDPQVAVAAARALGRIGTTKALKALQRASGDASATVHNAIVDAWLRGAQQLLASGSDAKALRIYQALFDGEREPRFRSAAFRGLVLASGKKGLPLAVRAIVGSDSAATLAALQLVREIQAPDATRTFAMLVNKVEPPLQVALIEGLAQRGDVTAAPFIAPLVTSPAPPVRISAINALGILGDSSLIPILGVAASSSTGDEQKAARLALVNLNRGTPTETLLRLLPDAKPEVQAEFARALGDRSEKSAVPKLVELARSSTGPTRKAVLQALAQLVDDSQLDLLVNAVAQSQTEADRVNAADALNIACHQILTRRGKLNVEPLVQELAKGPLDTRIALLPVCSSLVDPRIRTALRAAVNSSEPQIHVAAIRALCDTTDPELLPDVLKIACDVPEENLRTLGIRSCVRLTTQEETIKLPVKQQLDTLQALLAKPLKPEQKRVVLAGLAEIADPQALALAEPLLNEPDTQLEAARSITKIAAALPYGQWGIAKPALQKVIAATTDADARKAAETVLKEMQDGEDYIVAWQASGPYHRKGKEYNVLFDIPFPPETDQAETAKWQVLPLGTQAKRPWMMDLLKAFGGEQRVGYARTWVFSSVEQPARLDIGTDDGVKVWLNGVVVHTNNTFRGFTPGSDKVNVTLKTGWNQLLLKVTQLTAGWEFSAKFVKPDGSRLDGLQFALNPKSQ